MNNDLDVKTLINFLKELRNSSGPWIARKEVAAWSAAVLYLTGLFAFFQFFPVNSYNYFCILYSILIIFLLILFLFFIHTQFGALTSEVAVSQALNIFTFKLIEGKISLSDLDFTFEDGKAYPKFILDLTKYQQEHVVRQLKWFKRLAMPYYLLYSEKRIEYSSVEKEEGIIYDLLLISTLIFYTILFSNC